MQLKEIGASIRAKLRSWHWFAAGAIVLLGLLAWLLLYTGFGTKLYGLPWKTAIREYQTLVSGVLAIIAAVASIIGLWWLGEIRYRRELSKDGERAQEIAASLIGELLINRYAIRHRIEDETFIAVLEARNSGVELPFLLSTRVFDNVLPKLGCLGAERSKNIIITYMKAQESVEHFLLYAAQLYESCRVPDTENEVVVSENARNFQNDLRMQMTALDVLIGDLCQFTDSECIDEVAENVSVARDMIQLEMQNSK